MSAVSLTGEDTIQIDGRVLNDLADGDCAVLTYPNELAAVKASKNGNTVYAFNNMGRMVNCKIRVLVGSSDDKYLNSRLAQMIQDFSGWTLFTGSFCKRVGDGAGNMSTVVYQVTGGVCKKNVEAKTNADGDTEQSVAVYDIDFGNNTRSVQ